MIFVIELNKNAEKQLRRVPRHVATKLLAWVDSVETDGLEQVRRIPGFHDEPLRGKRVGQRSIRLSKAYRAIYIILEDESVQFVSIEEVTKHDY